MKAKMADLLDAVQWYGYHSGYASRHALTMDLREHAMARFADEETRRLIAEALSRDWIAQLGRDYAGPAYVLTRKGEVELARLRRLAA